MRTWWGKILVLILICAFPSAALADGVSPILNLFHKETWLPATVITFVIILVESGLLWWRIREIPFKISLWRSFVLNTASSITGSVLLIAFQRDSFFMWDTMAMVIPLFIITLATEIPLLRVLYRDVPLHWGRACILGLGINVVSYAIVFIFEIGLFIGFFSFSNAIDKRERAKANHPELLQQSTGRIYTTEAVGGGEYRLRVMDVKTGRWTSLTNGIPLESMKWDVQDNTCAFVKSSTKKKMAISIASLPNFTDLREIDVKNLVDFQSDSQSEWQGILDVSLSPDEKKRLPFFFMSLRQSLTRMTTVTLCWEANVYWPFMI